jgi:hypothetical protein
LLVALMALSVGPIRRWCTNSGPAMATPCTDRSAFASTSLWAMADK